MYSRKNSQYKRNRNKTFKRREEKSPASIPDNNKKTIKNRISFINKI